MEVITSKVGEPGERWQMSEEVEKDAEKVGGSGSSLTVDLIESESRYKGRESARSLSRQPKCSSFGPYWYQLSPPLSGYRIRYVWTFWTSSFQNSCLDERWCCDYRQSA
jgi:hypothetical protein